MGPQVFTVLGFALGLQMPLCGWETLDPRDGS